MPNTVRKIEKGAFEVCDMLKSVKFSKKLISIGDEAFCWNTMMEKYNLPKSLKNIGKKAFRKNYSLKLSMYLKRLKLYSLQHLKIA